MFVMALKNGERKMNQFVPKLFDCDEDVIQKSQFAKDVISGIIVAIIALPLINSTCTCIGSGTGARHIYSDICWICYFVS